MPYLKSAADIAELKNFFTQPRFCSQTLAIEFMTTPEFVREALPPCFDPIKKPLGYVSIAQYQSKGMGDFPCGWIHLACSYKGTAGIFPIASYFSNATNITWIREVWGEAGKDSKTVLFEDGSHYFGYCQRHGSRIIEVEADVGPEQVKGQALDMPSKYFELKLILSAKDGNLECDPAVNIMHVHESATSYKTGKGHFNLRNSPFDPLGEIPVVSTGEASWKVSTSRYEITNYETFPERDAYLPWAYTDRYWDDPRKMAIPKRFRA